jgi:hypothetical protein
MLEKKHRSDSALAPERKMARAQTAGPRLRVHGVLTTGEDVPRTWELPSRDEAQAPHEPLSDASQV